MKKFSALIRFPLALLTAASSFSTAAATLALEDILQTVQRPAVLTADFVAEKRSPAIAITLKSQGRLVLSQSKGLLWITTQPFDDALGFSQTKRGRLDDNGDWSVSENRSTGRAMEMTQKILTADPKSLSDHFFLSPSGTSSAWQLLASPKAGTAAQFLTEVLLAGSKHLQHVQIVQTDGTITRIDFSNINPAPVLSKDDILRLESLQ